MWIVINFTTKVFIWEKPSFTLLGNKLIEESMAKQDKNKWKKVKIASRSCKEKASLFIYLFITYLFSVVINIEAFCVGRPKEH